MIRYFYVKRCKLDSPEVDLKIIKLKLHNCIETATEEGKDGEKAFARVTFYKHLITRHLIGCKIIFFNDIMPAVTLVGFEGRHVEEDAPAVWMKIENEWYHKEHIRGIEIFPNQQSWEKDRVFEDVAVRITGMRGDQGAYLIVRKSAVI